jgi:long-subunit fatty acid transport protein
MKGYGSSLSTSITPALSYRINKKFTLGGGIRLDRTGYFDVPTFSTSETITRSQGSFTSATIFISGMYRVNDRFSIAGSAYKQIPISGEPLIYNPFNPYTTNKAQGIDLNLGYRVGKSLYFEAGFRYSEGGSGGRMNPFYMNDPFRNSVFQSGYSTW